MYSANFLRNEAHHVENNDDVQDIEETDEELVKLIKAKSKESEHIGQHSRICIRQTRLVPTELMMGMHKIMGMYFLGHQSIEARYTYPGY